MDNIKVGYYYIIDEDCIDISSFLFTNWFRNGIIKITNVDNKGGVVHFDYEYYGKFTGKSDGMNLFYFKNLIKSGFVKKIDIPTIKKKLIEDYWSIFDSSFFDRKNYFDNGGEYRLGVYPFEKIDFGVREKA